MLGMPDTNPPPSHSNGGPTSTPIIPPIATPVSPAPTVAPTSAPQKRYTVGFNAGKGAKVPDTFAKIALEFEQSLGVPLFLLMNGAPVGENNNMPTLGEATRWPFFVNQYELPSTRIALLIQSPGGNPQAAYQIARLLNKRCGGFCAIIADYAKSAATLLALGADQILMADQAELGPLDAQIIDFDREQRVPALDEVQALDRLFATSITAVDDAMTLLTQRTLRRTDAILPHAVRFVADMMRPLFEKIDAVQYSQRSRMLKVAEEYAVRLLNPHYSPQDAQQIATHLVTNYPDHGFVIDHDEARNVGLKIVAPTDDQAKLLHAMVPYLRTYNAIGRVSEVP